MSNLQVASMSLGVSTQIYGFHVDSMHMEILKMLGGLDKQEKEDKDENDEKQVDAEVEAGSDHLKKPEKKEKKKNKQQIFTTIEALKTNVETAKPSLISLETDSQSTDMLYQVTLPNHTNSRFYQHPYNDVLVDTVQCKDVQNKDACCSILEMKDFSDMHICPPLVYFDFQSWNTDDKRDEDEPEKDNGSRFQFDLDASLPNDEPER